MPRVARTVAVGYPHHITQRGNYRQTVFEKDEDYFQYIDWLKLYSERYSLKIWSYCLMQNHVHFIAVPMEPDSLAKSFNMIHMRYAQHVNIRNKSYGHLWQGRFYSCALDEKHLYAGIKYVENNPVRAGVVTKAEGYQWSSAPAHVLGRNDPVLSEGCYLVEEIKDWASYLRQQEETLLVEAIRKNTRTGRPCGGNEFIVKLEKLLGRRLSALPWGRPRKSNK
jgi:putative transposase